MDTATAKFQEALPYAFLPVSPALAALHTNTKPSDPYICSKCGAYLLNGNGQLRLTRLIRKGKNTPYTRALRSSCCTCGGKDDLSINMENAAFPPARLPSEHTVQESVDVMAITVHSPSSSPLPGPVDHSTAIPPTSGPKARPKKKSVLQDMLSRNRRKKEEERSKKQEGLGSGVLASFLSGL